MNRQDIATAYERREASWHTHELTHQRHKLFTPGIISGIGISLAVVLTLVFPRQLLERRLAQSYKNQKPDQLAISYLEAFLRTDPQSESLRMNLARELIRMGSLSDARNILFTLRQSADLTLREEVHWLDLDILEREVHAVNGNPDLRREIIDRVRTYLAYLIAMPQTPRYLLAIAHKGVALGDRSNAADALQRLAVMDPSLNSAQYAEAAHTALEIEEPQTAADLYFLAMDTSRSFGERRTNYMEALKTLRAGGLLLRVIPAADSYLGVLSKDRATLMFLIDLARALNQPDAAQRYAVSLMLIGDIESFQGNGNIRLMKKETREAERFHTAIWHVADRSSFILTAASAARETPANKSKSNSRVFNLPYDEQAYKAAFDAFISNRNVNDARLVAEAAVRHRPDDMTWRRRLATTSEWSGAPRAALPHWLEYSRKTGDQAGWDATLRLAEGTGDKVALRESLRHKLDQEPGNPALLLRLAKLQAAQGDTNGALILLRSQILSDGVRAKPGTRREALDFMAAIAEKAGRDDDVEFALRRMQRDFGQDSKRALRIASLLYRQGKQRAAFAAMNETASAAPDTDTDFWRNYAQLATLVHEDAVSISAYRRLLLTGAWNDSDVAALQSLLQKEQPLAASRVAEFGFGQTAKPLFASDALALMMRAGDQAGAAAFMSRIPPETMTTLRLDPSFLSMQASIQQAAGQAAESLDTLREALKLRPNNMDLRAAMVWGLIATRDTAGLKRVLGLWSREAENAPTLWGPFAAASMTLNRPTAALHWFRKRGFPRDDYLWMMSYAEALDATSQPDLARRIRRRAWTGLRDPQVLSKADPEQLRQMRNRLASLAPLYLNGDDALSMVRTLLRADVKAPAKPAETPPTNGAELIEQIERLSVTRQEATGANEGVRLGHPSMALLFTPGGGVRPRDDASLSAGAREVALAYAMSREENDLAREWLATQFSGQMTKPLWAEFAMSLQSDDREALGRMLDTSYEFIPALDQIEAQQRTGRYGAAETTAFDYLNQTPSSDALNARLSELTMNHVPTVNLDVRRFRQSPLEGTTLNLRLDMRLNDNTDLAAEIVENKFSISDPMQLPYVPPNDRQFWLTARRRTETGHVSASMMHREADANTNGVQVEALAKLSKDTTVTATGGLNLPATESALLRAGGQRSGAQATVNYQITRREYARATLGWQQYASQSGTTLGHGTNWIAEVGSNLRMDYPNLSVRAYASGISTASNGRFDAQIARYVPAGANPAAFPFVPGGDTVYGASVGVGTAVDGNYSRAIRPFIEVGITSSRVVGAGFNGVAGVQGSVFGNDILRLRLQHISGTAANPSGFKQIGVDYKWYY